MKERHGQLAPLAHWAGFPAMAAALEPAPASRLHGTAHISVTAADGGSFLHQSQPVTNTRNDAIHQNNPNTI
jgi:hypothetical protein